MDLSWHKKAHELIQEAAWDAYNKEKAKYKGKKYRDSFRYTLPKWVDDLINAMNKGDEERAKAIMMYQYLRDF